MTETTTAARKTTARKKTSARKRTSAQRRPRTTTPSKRTETKSPGNARSVPVLVPEVHVHQVRLPSMEMPRVPMPSVPMPHVSVPRVHLPEMTTNRVVWLGGLAGLAALGVINWPVAGVVAAGVYVAERRAESAMREQLAQEGPAAARPA